MSHSPLFDRLGRSLRRAFASRNARSGQPDRRHFLRAAIGAGVAASRLPAATAPNVSVGIVGAGLAGLSCAYELQKKGLNAQLFEASDRAGGRCFSMDFGSQTLERGGELIDTAHKTMIGYAREFGLTREEMQVAHHPVALLNPRYRQRGITLAAVRRQVHGHQIEIRLRVLPLHHDDVLRGRVIGPRGA